jgi:rhodanese-related sulfurtransferase/transcriptional regulator with XRE-family HTH domain
MPKIVDVQQAQQLMSDASIDVIDVRAPAEWKRGHVPRARNVPLEDLQANVLKHVSASRVLFVCARGSRSLKAAQAAEAAGIGDVSSLEGGTLAWEAARLPLEGAPAPAAAPATSAKSATSSASASASASASKAAQETPSESELENEDAPDPALDSIVAENLRKLREKRGMSLDELARLSGLSRTLLGQLEMGRTSPSVSLVWRLARAFDVHFSVLLGTAERVETTVLRESKAKRLVSPDGRFSSRALFNLAEKPNVEFYELALAAHSREDAQPHHPGTRENLIVASGRLELEVGSERFELAKGDAIVFTADIAHSYVNPGNEECRMYLVMTYAAPLEG